MTKVDFSTLRYISEVLALLFRANELWCIGDADDAFGSDNRIKCLEKVNTPTTTTTTMREAILMAFLFSTNHCCVLILHVKCQRCGINFRWGETGHIETGHVIELGIWIGAVYPTISPQCKKVILFYELTIFYLRFLFMTFIIILYKTFIVICCCCCWFFFFSRTIFRRFFEYKFAVQISLWWKHKKYNNLKNQKLFHRKCQHVQSNFVANQIDKKSWHCLVWAEKIITRIWLVKNW
jgi:hypothetical protein